MSAGKARSGKPAAASAASATMKQERLMSALFSLTATSAILRCVCVCVRVCVCACVCEAKNRA